MNMPLEKTRLTDNNLRSHFNSDLLTLINEKIFPSLTAGRINTGVFWSAMVDIVNEYNPLIGQLDQPAQGTTLAAMALPQAPVVKVDEEIALLAGPQLTASMQQANSAIKAANGRWGSLFDTLNERDAATYGKDFLDEIFPLSSGSHHDVASYMVYYQHVLAVFADSSTSGLKNPCQFIALTGHKSEPTSLLLKNNGLHIEIMINRKGQRGCLDLAGIDDIQIEAALTAIMDFSGELTDINGQIETYRNWINLLTGDCQDLRHDKMFTCKNGGDIRLHGRSLLLVRQRDFNQTTTLMTDSQGNPVSQGLIDLIMAALSGLIDLDSAQAMATNSGQVSNSRTGSIYFVKPRNSSDRALALTNRLLADIEQWLGLSQNTLKLVAMDDIEQLKRCDASTRERLVLLHTGLSERTGESRLRLASPCVAMLHALQLHTDPQDRMQMTDHR